MPTVKLHTAETIKANDGYYPGDHIRVVRIIEYTDQGGQQAYGLEYDGQPQTYVESPYVRNPKVFWKADAT